MAGTSGFQGSGNDCIQILPSTVLLGSEFSRSDPTQAVPAVPADPGCVAVALCHARPGILCSTLSDDNKRRRHGLTVPSGLIVGRFPLQAGPGE